MGVTLVIQGRVHQRFWDHSDVITQHFSQIILSTWRDFNVLHPTGWTIIKDDTDTYQSLHNSDNVALRTHSTLNGLLLAKHPFAVVMRGDEYYTEWFHFLTEMGRNQSRLTTNNVNFVRDSWNKFQCSDHVVAGKTETLINIYTTLATWINRMPQKNEIVRGDIHSYKPSLRPLDKKVTPENLLAFAHLWNMGIFPDDDYSVEIMRDWFHCVSVENMGEFCLKVGDNLFTTYEELFNYNRSIRDMSELALP